jgi:hypothetical protein
MPSSGRPADLRLEIGRLRARQQEHQRAPNAPPIPARQRASDASLRQRLEATNSEIRRLRHENQQLREQLAWRSADATTCAAGNSAAF